MKEFIKTVCIMTGYMIAALLLAPTLTVICMWDWTALVMLQGGFMYWWPVGVRMWALLVTAIGVSCLYYNWREMK